MPIGMIKNTITPMIQGDRNRSAHRASLRSMPDRRARRFACEDAAIVPPSNRPS
jgi:hypothetical protein